MAFPLPSVGDILLLSHLAWKISCAFTAGRRSAPREFAEVEIELKGLTSAITMLAETLDKEDSIYSRCDERTQKGLATIIGCCHQSLSDLDAFVAQYQDISRTDGDLNDGAGGSKIGMRVQGSWKPVLLRNWLTIKWTTEGGGIQSLRAKLGMHTQSITLAMQALQTRSLSRLENVIEPMAEKMDNIHNKLNGSLDQQIAEIHEVILSIKSGQQPPYSWTTPQHEPEDAEDPISQSSVAPSPPPKSPLRRSDSYLTPPKNGATRTPQRPSSHPMDVRTPELSDSDMAHSPNMPSPALTMAPSMSGSSSRGPRGKRSPAHTPQHDLFYYLDSIPSDHEGERNGKKPSLQSEASPNGNGVSPLSYPVNQVNTHLTNLSLKLPPPALDSPTASRVPSNFAVSPLTPDEHALYAQQQQMQSHDRFSRSSSVSNSGMTSPSEILHSGPTSPQFSQRQTLYRSSSSGSNSRGMSPHDYLRHTPTPSGMLETVADGDESRDGMEGEEDELVSAARAASLAGSVAAATMAATATAESSQPKVLTKRADRNTDDNTRKVASIAEMEVFERGIMVNATVLCEVTASSVDYAIQDEENTSDFVMQNACGKCKVYLITRSARITSGRMRYSTSIWILSEDRETRLQVPLPEDTNLIPYTVWNSPCKPIIRHPLALQYFPVAFDDKPLFSDFTSWLTFTFPSTHPSYPEPHHYSPMGSSAVAFQNALMDAQILLSVKTKRTMRIFDGPLGQFAFAEQLCGLENLRIILNPSSALVCVYLHYSPNFGDGYLVFPLNKSSESIRVREEDDRVVRIKGLRIPVGERDKRNGGRRASATAPATLERVDSEGKRVKVKREMVAGVKIEFSSVEDKNAFMDKLREVQDKWTVRA